MNNCKNENKSYTSSDKIGKKLSSKGKTEVKDDEKFSLIFSDNEREHGIEIYTNIKQGTITQEKTNDLNNELNENNFSFSFQSFNDFVLQEGYEDERINNFYIENYNINSKK